MLAGANAVQVGTANFVDPFIWPKLLDGITDYMRRHQIARLQDLVGAVDTRRRASGPRMNPILVALDVPGAERALALADQLRGAVGGFKIGKQLFTAEGPAIVRTLAERGDKVFLDLKFHDIPNTVAGAVASAVATGAWMVNVHCSGGSAMMRAAAESAVAAAAGLRRAAAAGDRRDRADQPGRRRRSPRSASTRPVHGPGAATWRGWPRLRASTASSPRRSRPRRSATACGAFAIVTPGIRAAAEAGSDDQARTMSAAEAMRPGPPTWSSAGRSPARPIRARRRARSPRSSATRA